MTQIRKPAVAGHFYPADAEELRAMVQQMLAMEPVQLCPAPKALVVPHAGYLYSGSVAATAYARLLSHREQYRRVILLGPCHQLAMYGIAASRALAFRTPLGDVPLDQDAIDLLNHSAVSLSDAAHLPEHSLEVQLPFLQVALGSFSLVPLAVGDVSPQIVAEVIGALWGGKETLLVVSSDLSHYLPADDARRRDQVTCKAIEEKAFDQIGPGDACGATPLGGLLIVAQLRGLKITTLDLRNSGDTAGGRGRVVGYGSWMLLEDPKCEQAA